MASVEFVPMLFHRERDWPELRCSLQSFDHPSCRTLLSLLCSQWQMAILSCRHRRLSSISSNSCRRTDHRCRPHPISISIPPLQVISSFSQYNPLNVTNSMSQTPTATPPTSNYQAIFDSALEAYKKKTKKDLRSHPLLPKLQSCNSPDAVLTLLQHQTLAVDPSRSTSSDDDGLIKWLNPTVHVLYTFSEAIGAAISLVSKSTFEVRQFKISCSLLYRYIHPQE